MRSAKEAGGDFPYTSKLLCYIKVDSIGAISQLPSKNKCDRAGLEKAFLEAKAGKCKLYAVWPGNYSSDLFEIDDLDAFASAFGHFV